MLIIWMIGWSFVGVIVTKQLYFASHLGESEIFTHFCFISQLIGLLASSTSTHYQAARKYQPVKVFATTAGCGFVFTSVPPISGPNGADQRTHLRLFWGGPTWHEGMHAPPKQIYNNQSVVESNCCGYSTGGDCLFNSQSPIHMIFCQNNWTSWMGERKL